MAGIALGPSLLGMVWPDAMAALFPADSMVGLGLTAQLGLVFFMFLVGLEFDPRLLQGQARSSLAISGAGILAPFALGAGSALLLHADLAPAGVGPVPFALFLGVAMSVTAFPVLARILTESRLIKTRIGAVALAAAAVGDAAAWCLLALVVAVATASGIGAAFGTAVLALGYCAAVWFVVRPMLARIGPREGKAVSTDVVAMVFLLLIASASVTEWIGIHALFGSFLIGAAMPRHGGLATVIAEKTEDFVTVVLLPLFFAYSGLRTQIGLLDSGSDWATCALLIVVASVGKFGGTALAARATGLSLRESAGVGVLMNTRGLMELVVLNVGLDLGVISERLFAMMVIMALVTTWVTSPLLRWLFPPGPSLEPRPARAEQGGLLLCLSDPAMAEAMVRLASRWRDGPVWALHLRSTDRPHDYLRVAPDTEGPLDAVARRAAEHGVAIELLTFASAAPAADIVRIAALKKVTAVVLGVHRSTLGRETFGGVTGRVANECRAVVGVLVDNGLRDLRRIGVRGDDPAVDEFAARLFAAGQTQRVDPAAADIDLLLQPWDPDASPPAPGTPSTLFVRGRL